MSTDAELAGAIEIDEKPFVESMKKAEDAWNKFGDTLKRSDGIWQDAQGRWRNASGQFASDAEKMASGVDSSFKKVSSSGMAMSVAIGNIVADVAQKMASMATSVISAGFAFNGLKEQATVAFTKMLGSGQAAKSFLDELFNFAAKTPFEFPDVLRAAQKFKAMGFEAKAVIPALTSIGDAVAGMGGSSVQVERVTNAILQMKAKGKVSAEEMTQQLGEVIPAWKLLANELGISIPEAQKKVEKGAIDVDVAIKALLAGMTKEFGGMMGEQAKSWQGMLSTMKDVAAQTAGQIMEPLFNASKDVLGKILAGLPDFQVQFNAAWKSIVAEVGNSLSQLRPTVEVALNDVKNVWQTQHSEIMNITKTAWTLIYSGFIRPAVEGISRLISISSAAFAGDWESAMRRIVGSTDKASNAVLGTVGRWVQALARVTGIVTGLGTAVNAASNLGGPRLAVSASVPLKFDTAKLEQDAKDAGAKVNKAFGSGLKGGGGKGKGSSEAEKAMRELLSSINEYVAATGNGVRITEQAWVNSSEAIRQSMIKQRNEFVANKEATAALYLELKGGLLTVYPQLGAAITDYIRNMEKSTIVLESASSKILEFIQPSKALAAEVKKAEKDLEDSNKKIQKMNDDAAKEAEKAAKKIHDAMLDQFEDLSRKLPDSWNVIIDGIVNGSGRAGDAVYELGIKIKGWAGDILGVIDTLPGKFGDAAKKIVSTVDQWVQFANKVLAVLNRLDSSIPGSIGGIVEKIAGMFKKTQATATTGMEGISGVIKNASEDWSATLEDMSNGVGDSVGKAMNKAQGAAKTGMSGFIDTIKGGLGFAAGLFGSFMTGLGVANSTGSKTQGAVMGGISGALSGAAFGAQWGAAGGPIGLLGGALIGGAVGIIGGLFGGGKSKEQKAAEEAAKQKAGLDMQKLAADIMTSQMEGLKKGYELLEGLRTFSEVPRKAIKRFFNEIETIITLFAEMAKKFKADSIEASKTVAEVMTGAFESLISGANLIQAIKQVGTVTEQNITDFISTTFTIFQKWSDAADKIEISTAKFTGKISDKLRTSFEFLNLVPELLKGITENKGFDASLIDPLFDSVSKIVAKMKALSEAERGMELNRTGATATILATIFDTTKSIVEALSLFSNYKPLGEGAFSPINGDIVKVTDWMGSLVSTTASWGSLADAALANVNRWADGLGKIASSIKLAIGGASSSSGITANITSQSGALYARGSGASSSSTSSTRNETININLNFSGTVITEGELLRKTREEVTKLLKERDDRLKLAVAS